MPVNAPRNAIAALLSGYRALGCITHPYIPQIEFETQTPVLEPHRKTFGNNIEGILRAILARERSLRWHIKRIKGLLLSEGARALSSRGA